MEDERRRFGAWLNLTMERHGLSQAELARAVGVADAQVSRWRRGRVIPTVHSLQRIADTLGVPRTTLDYLAGYPPGAAPQRGSEEEHDAALQAELQVYQAWYRQLLEQQVPRSLWGVYVEGCAALARTLRASWQAALHQTEQERREPDSEGGDAAEGPARPEYQGVGFRPQETDDGDDE